MNDPNPRLSPRSQYLNRDLTTWDYDAITQLLDGNEDFALYAEQVDHEMVFFWAHNSFWLFTRAPTVSWDAAAPEVVIDWIGAAAEKEPGAEPVLMHHNELPTTAREQIETVRETNPEHVYD